MYEHSVALYRRRIIQDRRPLVCKMFPDIMDHGMVQYMRYALMQDVILGVSAVTRVNNPKAYIQALGLLDISDVHASPPRKLGIDWAFEAFMLRSSHIAGLTQALLDPCNGLTLRAPRGNVATGQR